ncbi:hypothetical protein LTR62_008011 [Meristemomyces frigidus]|uniref:SH3 domain-containing protein n=1 Tax=Meristemomyces frigidus TaxID=1508187 RepID=A0AAN7TN68_9PEZI|nr:hypothetical protein LTR62_008011 [Meristemomyces frigidus]
MIRCQHICSSCRLHQQFRARLLSLQQARRCFSVSSSIGQQQQQQQKHQEQQHTSNNGAKTQDIEQSQGRRDDGNGALQGRYSGQTLQPAQLLHQLSSATRNPPTNPRSLTPRERNDSPTLPPTLEKALREFLDLRRRGGDRLDLTWPLLQQLAASPDAKLLARRTDFTRVYVGFVLTAAKHSVTTELKTGERPRPRPSDVLNLREGLEIHIGDTWARVLWRMARRLLTLRAKNELLKEQWAQLEEVMRVWHLALRARLQRHRDVLQQASRQQGQDPGESENLNWSFLPPIHIFTEMLNSSKRRGNTSMFFLDGLKMLLPEVQSDRVSARVPGKDREEIYDYASAALITLDFLREFRDFQSDVMRTEESYGDFREFVETVLRVLPGEVPVAIQTLRDEAALGRFRNEVVSVLRRSGLGDTEVAMEQDAKQLATNTESTAVASPVGAEDPASQRFASYIVAGQMGTVVYAHVGVDPRELSVTEGERVTILEDDDGSGWLKVRSDAFGSLIANEGDVPTSYIEVEKDDNRANTPEAVHAAIFAGEGIVADTDSIKHTTIQSTPLSSSTKAQETTDNFVGLRINRLGQAVQKHALPLAENIKREIFSYSTRSDRPSLPDRLYEYLLLSLLQLHSPKSALEVWSHFTTTLKRAPTVKTYTVMMQGAQHVRDVGGLERFWAEMGNAGVKPDVNAWTTRIFGLIRGGQVDQGLKALGVFGREWLEACGEEKAKTEGRVRGARRGGGKAAQHGDQSLSPAEAIKLFPGEEVNGVPKPSQVAMNAAISALATREDRHIGKVLAWGRSFGLKPDQTTYNVLLNISVRHGHLAEAQGILQRMREEGIETSGETWTVLLNQVMESGGLEGLPPDEVQEKIMSLITALEDGSAAKKVLDLKAYALVIDRLLKRHDNPQAANAVLAHMLHRGVQPSTHIYTILMTSHLNPGQSANRSSDEPISTPRAPDFEAANALWQHILAANGGRGAHLDTIFYDRMIESYALHHRTLNSTQQLHYFLSRAYTEGRRPSWRALLLAGQAMAERGEWGPLMEMVDRARRDAGGEEEGGFLVGKANFGARQFWEFVLDSGVLGEEGVGMGVEGLMKGKSGRGGPLGGRRR